jgi:hypothetical protein
MQIEQYFHVLEKSQAQCKHILCCFGDNKCVITVIFFIIIIINKKSILKWFKREHDFTHIPSCHHGAFSQW